MMRGSSSATGLPPRSFEATGLQPAASEAYFIGEEAPAVTGPTSAGNDQFSSGELPVYRLVATDYDGCEWQESMTPDGVVYTAEVGYLPVQRHQNVLIWPHTATHGHGGNLHDEYVWGRTIGGAVGWLPVSFRMEFAGQGLITPAELEEADAAADAAVAAAAAGSTIGDVATGRVGEEFEC
jgi:hypothetical protein